MGLWDQVLDFFNWYEQSEQYQTDQAIFNDWQTRVYNNGEELGIHFDQTFQDQANAAAARLNSLREYKDAQAQKVFDDAQTQMLTADLNPALADAKPPVSNNINTGTSTGLETEKSNTQQSGAAWYDRTWREIKAANPDWTDQQVYDEMTRQINEADWNARYNKLIADIANSSSVEERDQLIRKYREELKAYRASGINVNNDLAYLGSVQGIGSSRIEPQYLLDPLNDAFADREYFTEEELRDGVYYDEETGMYTTYSGVPLLGEQEKFETRERVKEQVKEILEGSSKADNTLFEFNIGGYGFRIVDDREEQKVRLSAKVQEWAHGMEFLGSGYSAGGLVPPVKIMATKMLTATERVIQESSKAESVSIKLKYKEGWTVEQKAAADAKIKALNNSEAIKTTPQRSGTSASSRYKKANGPNSVPEGSDVDHKLDLQLGGKDDITNMWPLDKSVNRSLGKQIDIKIRDLPDGTPIEKFEIGE